MNDFEFTGRIIKEAREAKGWTQLQLADALDVDIRTVRRETRRPSNKTEWVGN